jgi:hypothetical protein
MVNGKWKREHGKWEMGNGRSEWKWKTGAMSRRSIAEIDH